MEPPAWAVMQRALLNAQIPVIETFHSKYFDERGYLRCVPRWGGDEGADDAAENFTGWTLLYTLGADRFHVRRRCVGDVGKSGSGREPNYSGAGG